MGLQVYMQMRFTFYVDAPGEKCVNGVHVIQYLLEFYVKILELSIYDFDNIHDMFITL